jgi:membrane-associated phospholipid phosphatase
MDASSRHRESVADEPLPSALGPAPWGRRRAGTRQWLHGGRRFWIVLTLLATATLPLSVGAHLTARYPGDVRLAQGIQSVDVPVLGGVLHVENSIGSPWPAVTIIAMFLVVLFVTHHAGLAVLFAGTNALWGVSSIVKGLVVRPRPAAPLVRISEHASGASFPSGHVVSAVLLYGMVAVLVEMVSLPRSARRGVQVICLLVIVLMGPARVYVGAHWPSDVLGGYLWGSLLLVLVLGVRANPDRFPHAHPHGSG